MSREPDSPPPVADDVDLTPEEEQQLNELLVDFLDADLRGKPLDRAQVLSQYPKLGNKLKQLFADHDQIRKLSEPLRNSASNNSLSGESAADGPSSAQALTGSFSPTGAEQTASVRLRLSPGQPQRFADYEILEEIARGGMGVVYKARQVSLDRTVAVKMILAGELADASDVKRFRAEAEAAANLQHPNIVGIYEVGQHEGQHYFSMECVEGRSLAQIAREKPLPARCAARYLRQIAEAVEYAHGKGILHRDLKPSNVLIDASDQARVMDFGLAKRVEADQGLTVTGQILGTPPYMPPEQVTGKRNRVGPASDVYSLGATLYELLTGRPPFRGETPWDTLAQVREQRPVPPRLLNPNTPRDLERICLKCLEKDPQHRYPSARALADDLQRFLDGDSISIASLNLVDRLARALQYGHHDVEFRTWGSMTLCVAGIVLVTHTAIFLVNYLGASGLTLWLGMIRAVEFLSIATVLLAYRRDWFPPRGIPARQFWAIWIGYLTGTVVLLAAGHLWATPQRPFEELTLYPQLAVLASLGFIVLGSSYWGYCYAFGAGMILLALVMSLFLTWAPLMFGVGLGLCFLILGMHLRRLARDT